MIGRGSNILYPPTDGRMISLSRRGALVYEQLSSAAALIDNPSGSLLTPEDKRFRQALVSPSIHE